MSALYTTPGFVSNILRCFLELRNSLGHCIEDEEYNQRKNENDEFDTWIPGILLSAFSFSFDFIFTSRNLGGNSTAIVRISFHRGHEIKGMLFCAELFFIEIGTTEKQYYEPDKFYQCDFGMDERFTERKIEVSNSFLSILLNSLDP
jgi:hypothetical protein